MRRVFIVIVLGLAVGIGAGLMLGWQFPINTVKVAPASLAPQWQADWVLMTAEAYSLDGDLEQARQRLALLGEGDPGARVAQRGELALAEGLPPSYIGALARLAVALGARSPSLVPYLAR